MSGTVTPGTRPARIAVTLALAHMIQQAINRGEIRDQAEAARRLAVTRARMTQILDLTLLAPDIQEVVLSPGSVAEARSPSERVFRRASRSSSWAEQSHLFGAQSPEQMGFPSNDVLPSTST